jgi:hypothetical protein
MIHGCNENTYKSGHLRHHIDRSFLTKGILLRCPDSTGPANRIFGSLPGTVTTAANPEIYQIFPHRKIKI